MFGSFLQNKFNGKTKLKNLFKKVQGKSKMFKDGQGWPSMVDDGQCLSRMVKDGKRCSGFFQCSSKIKACSEHALNMLQVLAHCLGRQ